MISDIYQLPARVRKNIMSVAQNFICDQVFEPKTIADAIKNFIYACKTYSSVFSDNLVLTSKNDVFKFSFDSANICHLMGFPFANYLNNSPTLSYLKGNTFIKPNNWISVMLDLFNNYKNDIIALESSNLGQPKLNWDKINYKCSLFSSLYNFTNITSEDAVFRQNIGRKQNPEYLIVKSIPTSNNQNNKILIRFKNERNILTPISIGQANFGRQERIIFEDKEWIFEGSLNISAINGPSRNFSR